MKNQGLFELFLEELENAYSSKKQILRFFPKLVKLATFPELKEALSTHLKKTEKQLERIEKISSLLDQQLKEKKCIGIEGLLKEAAVLTENKETSVLDAAIISAAQKVKHYEIASYGTLKSFATQMDMNIEVVNLIQDTLNEEKAADKKLTKIAEGTFFSTGVNEEADVLLANERKRGK